MKKVTEIKTRKSMMKRNLIIDLEFGNKTNQSLLIIKILALENQQKKENRRKENEN